MRGNERVFSERCLFLLLCCACNTVFLRISDKHKMGFFLQAANCAGTEGVLGMICVCQCVTGCYIAMKTGERNSPSTWNKVLRVSEESPLTNSEQPPRSASPA